MLMLGCHDKESVMSSLFQKYYSAPEFSIELSAKKSPDEQWAFVQSMSHDWFKQHLEYLEHHFLIIDKSISFQFLEYLGSDLISKSTLANTFAAMMTTLKALPEQYRFSFVQLLGEHWLNQKLRKFRELKNLITGISASEQEQVITEINSFVLSGCICSIFDLINIVGVLPANSQKILIQKLHEDPELLYDILNTQFLPGLIYRLSSSEAKDIIYSYSKEAPDFIEIDINEVFAADVLSDIRILLDQFKQQSKNYSDLLPCFDELYEFTVKPHGSYEKAVEDLEVFIRAQAEQFEKNIDKPEVKKLLADLIKDILKFHEHKLCKKIHSFTCILNSPRASESSDSSDDEKTYADIAKRASH